jgi:hypothetical protein
MAGTCRAWRKRRRRLVVRYPLLRVLGRGDVIINHEYKRKEVDMARKKVADIVRVDGTVERLPTTVAKMDYQQVQKVVGGYIEHLRVRGVGDLWCNEDGLSMGLLRNQKASEYMGTHIVGDVIIETFETTSSLSNIMPFAKTMKGD